MIGGKKRHSALSAENHKRSKQAHEEENNRAETSSWDNDQQQDVSIYEDLSSLDSISDSIASASSSLCQDEPCVDGLAEVVIKLDIDLNDARKRKENLPDVLKAEIALRNTSGGIIKINSPEKPKVKDRDDLMKELYEKRKTLLGCECGENDSFDDIIDIETKESSTYIFVRKSSVPIITNDSHLRQRSEERNYKVTMYSRICKVLNTRKKRCICANEGKFKTSLHLGDTLSYETMTEEHKLLNPKKSEKLAKSICGKLSDNVVAFANTQGGTIYFGIEDNNASIKGQKIKDDEEKADIHRSIVECIERKLWALDSGEEYKPKEGADYYIKFFPLDRGDDNRFVIAVHICAFHGAAVFRQTPECSVLDQENKVVNMEFNEWLFLHNRTSVGNDSDRQKMNCKNRGRTVYYTVQETIEDIYNDLIEASPGRLKIRPNYGIDSIHHRSLNTLITSLNKMFKKSKLEGITFIERCWGVNMGLPNTKPAKVICDILVCSPSIPLLLVSLTEEATSEAFEYNRKLAATLKRTLAQDGGCTEKFYVKPITLTCSEANDIGQTEMMNRAAFYPDAYQMSKEKYAAIIKALVPVLARVNSSAKDDVGKRIFNLLTKEQYDILFENFDSKKLMITGPPGSGKTILANERIHRLRRQGFSRHEVLFVCSNKVLEAQVRNMTLIVDGKREQLCLVHNYFGIISRLRDDRVDEFAGVKHILIDECQNFKNKPRDVEFDWWKKFMNLYDDRHPPSLWIFSDMHQQVTREACILDRRLQDGFSTRQLTTVIRTTGKIHRFISERFMNGGQRIHLGHDFEGEEVEVVVPKKPSRFKGTRKQRLLYILISYLKDMVEKGVDPSTIGVLFTDENQKKHYQKLFDECTRHCPIHDGQAVSKPGSVMFETIRIFSGCDKDTIIGFCPHFDPNSAFQNNDALMVSLCSRAKLKLILILEDEDVASSFGLDDCMEEKDVQWDQGDIIDF